MNPSCVVRSVGNVTPCHGWLIQAVDVKETRRTSDFGNSAVFDITGKNCSIIIACARWLIAKWFSKPSLLRPGGTNMTPALHLSFDKIECHGSVKETKFT
jgi:hypothetical protein